MQIRIKHDLVAVTINLMYKKLYWTNPLAVILKGFVFTFTKKLKILTSVGNKYNKCVVKYFGITLHIDLIVWRCVLTGLYYYIS